MLARRIFEWARVQPNKTALVQDSVPLDYAAFARAIEATHAFLARQNLTPGDTVVVLSAHLQSCWLIILALHAIGIDTIAVQSVDQVDALRLKHHDRIVCTPADQRAHDLGPHSAPWAKIVVVPQTLYDANWSGPVPPTPDIGRYGSHILYTSGTTGSYKKVLVTAAVAERKCRMQAEVWGFGAGTVLNIGNLGLWTAAGYSLSQSVWSVGGTVVVDQRTNSQAHILDHGVTDMLILPQDFTSIFAALGPTASPARGVKIWTGGGLVPLTVAQTAIKRLAETLMNCYSSTECPGVMHQRFEGLDDLMCLTPHSWRTVEVVDENGARCAPGQEGELRVQLTEFDCDSYLDDAEASAAVFRHGYFYPGDRAAVRVDGRIRVLGRASDVLNFQGQKIAVGPIEEDIRRRLGVDDVCLFMDIDGTGEERLIVAVQSDSPVPREERDALIGAFPAVQHIRFAMLKEFPRLAAGFRKVDRIALRRLASGMIDTASAGSIN